MKRYLAAVRAASAAFAAFAGVALVFLMLLTIADVGLRLFGRPIVGTYELVALSGAVVIGLAVPFTSSRRAHIYVDSFVSRLPRTGQAVLAIATRLAVLGLFALIAWNLFVYAGDLRRAGEVSPTLRVPFWPVAAAVGVSCLLQCLVMVGDVVETLRGDRG